MPPQVARCAHGHGLAGALEDDDVLDAGTAAGERLVGRRLQFHDLATAPAAVGRDHELRPGVLDAVPERHGGEAAEHHRVNRADAIAGVHGHDHFGHQRHVDDDAIAVLDALRLERVGEAAHFGVQLPVAQAPRVTRLALEDDRGLVAALGQVYVQAVHRGIQPPVGEPAVVGCVAVIQSVRKGHLPLELPCGKPRPEADVIRAGLRVQLGKIVGLDAGPRREGGWRGERALLQQDRLDVLFRHGLLALLLQLTPAAGVKA